MPLLLRSATQVMVRRRQLVPLLFAFATLVIDDQLEEACYVRFECCDIRWRAHAERAEQVLAEGYQPRCRVELREHVQRHAVLGAAARPQRRHASAGSCSPAT